SFQHEFGRLSAMRTVNGSADAFSRKFDAPTAGLTITLEIFGSVHFLPDAVQNKRNLSFVFGVNYGIDTGMSDKYIREHSARLEDYFITRRQFLQRAAMGFGALSLAALFGEELVGPSAKAQTATGLTPHAPHFAAKAKHVVHIFAQG